MRRRRSGYRLFPVEGAQETEKAAAVRVTEGACSIATFRNALIVIWRASPTVEGIAAIEEEGERLLERYPAGVGGLSVAPARLPPPGGAARQRAAVALPRLSGQAISIAVVIEGEGVWAGAARGIASGMVLMGRLRCPVRVASSVRAAAAWQAPLLAERLGEAFPPDALCAAVEGARRASAGVPGGGRSDRQ